jgi:hypothetical protein
MANKLSEAGASNTPNPDDSIKLFFEAERLKGKVDEANGKLRSHLKLMEERGVNLKAVALLRKLRRLDGDEATLLMRDVGRMGRWLQMPVFTQASLFPSDDAPEPSEEGKGLVAEQEAWDEGVAAGKAGRAGNDTRFEPGTMLHQRFSQGWVAGQSTLAAKLTDDPKKAAETRAAGGRRPGRRRKQEEAGSEA